MFHAGIIYVAARGLLTDPVRLVIYMGRKYQRKPRWFYILVAALGALWFSFVALGGFVSRPSAFGFDGKGLGWLARVVLILSAAVGARRYAVALRAVCFLELEDLHAWFQEHRVGYFGALLREHSAVREQGNQVSQLC